MYWFNAIKRTLTGLTGLNRFSKGLFTLRVAFKRFLELVYAADTDAHSGNGFKIQRREERWTVNLSNIYEMVRRVSTCSCSYFFSNENCQ